MNARGLSAYNSLDHFHVQRLTACRKFFNFFCVSLLCIASLIGVLHTAKARASGSVQINELTDIVIAENGRSLQLFGTFNPSGPHHAVPYLQVLATSLLLPEERGPPHVRGSVPGFSLNLTTETLRNLPAYRVKMAAGSEVERLREAYYSNETVRRHLHEYGMPQAWMDIREMLKRSLYGRLSRQEGDAVAGQIQNVEQLKEALRRLESSGTLRPDDSDEIIGNGIARFQAKPGNIFFFPEGTTEDLYGAAITAEPAFYGVPNYTQFARIVFEADLALKQLASDPTLRRHLPFHQTYMEWVLTHSTPAEIRASTGNISAIQGYPNHFVVGLSPDHRVISVQQAEMTIQMRPYDANAPPTPVETSYGEFLTAHYDAYAREFPAIWELRELSKVMAVARTLKSSSLYIPLDRSWTAPKLVKGSWLAGTFGAGQKAFYLVSFFNGGIALQIQRQTQTTHLSADVTERFRRAAAQLEAVRETANTGICYDSGCRSGQFLAAVTVDIPKPGSASISAATLARMRVDPTSRRLLDTEERERAALSDAEAKVRQKETALASASASNKGQLQVEVAEARQAESNIKSVLQVTEIKVSEAAKVIEEVELVTPPASKK